MQLWQTQELLLVVTGTCHATSNSFITFISDKIAASVRSKGENGQSSDQTNEGYDICCEFGMINSQPNRHRWCFSRSCCEEVGDSTKTHMIDGNGELEPGANFTPVAFRVSYICKNALLGETGSTRQTGMGEGS